MIPETVANVCGSILLITGTMACMAFLGCFMACLSKIAYDFIRD